MSLFERFVEYIDQNHLFKKDDLLLLAVSGGADSSTLCELCHQAGFNFQIAHCNFQLRGQESDRDEEFVKSLGEKYNVPVFTRRFDTQSYAAENHVSIQVAAREVRYRWFNELMQKDNSNDETRTVADWLLTAHNANDNVETLLMNFFKGTGMKGLQGIQRKQGKILRPMLFATRHDIESFIQENELSFVEDSSNNSAKYTRNYFRLNIIPAIEKVFPEAVQNLLANIGRLQDIGILYDQAIALHLKSLLEYKGNEVYIPLLKLSKIKPVKTVLYEILKDYGFSPRQTNEVMQLLSSETGKYICSATHMIFKNRKWLVISPVDTKASEVILIKEEDQQIVFPDGIISISKITDPSKKISRLEHVATIDSKIISFPLLLRKWEKGDYFYPLGMKKKKKLSRFLIDRKLSLADKEKVWVIESNKRIVWVVGHRIDDRFRVTEHSKHGLCIHFNKY